MSGTQYFPSIDAEPEAWTPDPTRWPRLRATAVLAAVTVVGGVAGWWWTADRLAAALAATSVMVVVCAAVLVTVVARLDAFDRRHAAADRDRERLALEMGVLRTRQDTDHATVSVLGQRLEEQHLAMGECRSQRRNNVLDLNRRRAP